MKEFTYKLLKLTEIDAIEKLQQVVIDSLEDATILQPLSRAELNNILGDNGVMLGAFDGDKLIACRALLMPDPSEEEHLGIDAGASDLTRVLYQEVSFVHPTYRGQGLQKKLGARIMDCVNIADFDFVCATVKPFNIASLKDKFSQGMHVVALKLKYGGKLRYVFAKPLHTNINVSDDAIIVEMADTEKQQTLLSQGYVGCDLQFVEEKWLVTFKNNI
jgi:predicted GNAT superfamily acetyltransferase